MQKTFQQKKRGFMLIELSIAIVVIGLLFAGVSGGVVLIDKAKLQSDISAIQNLRNAAIMFKSSYDAAPGRLTETRKHFENSISDGSVATYICSRKTENSGSSAAADGRAAGVTGNTSSGDFKVAGSSGSNMAAVSYSSIAMCQIYASKTSDYQSIPSEKIAPGKNAPALKTASGASMFYINDNNALNYYIVIGNGNDAGFDGTLATVGKNLAGNALFKLDSKLEDGNEATGDFTAHKTITAGGTGTADTLSKDCDYNSKDKECVATYLIDL